jgi:hypothetical protein
MHHAHCQPTGQHTSYCTWTERAQAPQIQKTRHPKTVNPTPTETGQCYEGSNKSHKHVVNKSTSCVDHANARQFKVMSHHFHPCHEPISARSGCRTKDAEEEGMDTLMATSTGRQPNCTHAAPTLTDSARLLAVQPCSNHAFQR